MHVEKDQGKRSGITFFALPDEAQNQFFFKKRKIRGIMKLIKDQSIIISKINNVVRHPYLNIRSARKINLTNYATPKLVTCKRGGKKLHQLLPS